MADDSNRTDGNDPRTAVAWYRVYLVLTVISTVLVGLTQVGVPPFDDLEPVAAAGLVVALFAVASIAYWYDVRRWRRRNESEPPDLLVSLDEEIPYEEPDENGDGERRRNGERRRDDERGRDDDEEMDDENW